MKSLILITCVFVGFCSCQFMNDLFDNENYERGFKNIIVLIESTNSLHHKINDQFQDIASMMGFDVHRPILIPGNEIDSAIFTTNRYAREPVNVVNLRVPPIINTTRVSDLYDFYQSEFIVCTYNCNFMGYSRMVSNSILQLNGLREVLEMDKMALPHEIIICLPWSWIVIDDAFPNLRLNYDCTKDMEIHKNTLAVIADKPWTSNSDVPVILCQTSYFYPEYKDNFPNSINLSPPWRLLRHAFVGFLNRMQWARIALLSDDSESSGKFAEGLSILFRREGYAYTALECEGRHCNFTKALETLKSADARVIILNVESGKNARNLVSALQALHMTGVKWIVREWPFDEIPHMLINAYAISMFPLYESSRDHKNNAYSSSIVEGLNIVKDIYKSVLGDLERFKSEFNAKAELKENNPKYIAQVMRYNKFPPEEISTMKIIRGKAKIITFKPHQGDQTSDLPEACIVRSYDFFKPCQYETLLLLLTVIIMFMLLLIISMLYFRTYRENLRYNRFP